MTQMVKNPVAKRDTQVPSLGQEDLLEEGMATHSSVLAWGIPWTEDLVGFSPWGHRVGHNQVIEHAQYIERHSI